MMAKMQPFWWFISRVLHGEVILGNNDPTWNAALACSRLDKKVAAYGTLTTDKFALQVDGTVVDRKLYAYCGANIHAGNGFRAQIYYKPSELNLAVLKACSDPISLSLGLQWATFTFPSDVSLVAGRYALSVSGGSDGYYAQIGGLRGQAKYYVSVNGTDQCCSPYGDYGVPYVDYLGLIYVKVAY